MYLLKPTLIKQNQITDTGQCHEGVQDVVDLQTGNAVKGPAKGHRQASGLNFFITESGFDTCFGWDLWDPAPKVLG